MDQRPSFQVLQLINFYLQRDAKSSNTKLMRGEVEIFALHDLVFDVHDDSFSFLIISVFG